MEICIVDSLKRRNNARSNLAQGLVDGFSQLGVNCIKIQDATELKIDPLSIPEQTSLVIVPYWIGPKPFSMNLADIKRVRPQARVALYTGTSPFWEGCPWINYRPSSRTLHPDGLTLEQKLNFEAIDAFLVVWPRDHVQPLKQVQVGMGLFDELRPGTKSNEPVVVLDFMKHGWDEKQYSTSVKKLTEICAKMPSLKVVALGRNPMQGFSDRVLTIPNEFTPWHQMVALWQTAWAFIAMNESFGYPVVENLACGTQVFCDPTCEMPSCHDVRDIADLEEYLHWLLEQPPGERDVQAQSNADQYRSSHPDFVSWQQTCQNIVKAMQ